MTNATFHKLCHEFDFMYSHAKEFHNYCNSLGIMTKTMYGTMEASGSDMKNAKKYWKSQGNPWFTCWEDWENWEEKHNSSSPYGIVGSMSEDEMKQWCIENGENYEEYL